MPPVYGPFDSIALSGAPLHEQILTGRQIELPVREYFSGRRFWRIRWLAGFPGRGQGMPEARGGRQGKGESQTGAFIGIVHSGNRRDRKREVFRSLLPKVERTRRLRPERPGARSRARKGGDGIACSRPWRHSALPADSRQGTRRYNPPSAPWMEPCDR